MRSTYLPLFIIPLALLVPLRAAAPPIKPNGTRLCLKSGYSQGKGLLDKKFSSFQLIVEIQADGSGKGWFWEDPNIRPDLLGFVGESMGEVPEGGSTCMGWTNYRVTLRREPIAGGRVQGQLFRVSGLGKKSRGVTGEVYLAEHTKEKVTVYRLFRVQEKRTVESILLETKVFER